MEIPRIGRRDWLKLGGLGGAANLFSSCSPTKSPATSPAPAPVRGIVFMVSDGMSHGVLTMAEDFSRITRDQGTSWWQLLAHRESAQGLMETSSANSYVTDSAAASSAWGGGVKVNNASVNIRPDGSESVPIMRQLKALGHRTGLVTTTTITHATPAGFAAVTPRRDDEHLIAPQYLGVVDILLGGGMRFFDPRSRPDSRNLLKSYTDAGYSLVRDRDSIPSSPTDRVLGLFTDSHLPYEVDRLNSPALAAAIPSLSEMTAFALGDFLSRPEKFLLQIEGGRVDHGAHTNDVAALLWDQLAFDDALAEVMRLTAGRDDILAIVTSDHGNANPGLNGTGKEYLLSDDAFKSIARMTGSYESLFKIKKDEPLDIPAAALTSMIREKLGFTLKSSESAMLRESLLQKPVIEWAAQLANPYGLLGQFAGNHTGIGWTGTSHTSDPTIISAIGPQSSRFSGIVPNQRFHQHFLDLLT